jgi:hypothetical protein
MDDDSKNKLKDVLSAIDPVEFKWDETNMSSQTGFIAEEIESAPIDISGTYDTISLGPLNPIDLGNITGIGASGSSGAYLSSNGIGQSTYTIGSSQPSINIGSDGTKSFIQTNKHKIDIDELGDMMATLKKRLLILTPNFEMHEKYPMLKEMYDEYKAMEKLLGGPDSDEQ